MTHTHQESHQDRPGFMGTFFILISASAFGFMAIFAKYAYQAKLNVLTILSLRFFIAAAIMWLVVLIRRENPLVSRKQLLTLVGMGMMGYGLMSSLFFTAVKLIPASIAAILLYTYPVMVTVLSAWLYKEKITKYKVISLIVSSIGLILVVGVAFDGLNFLGVFYGFMSAVVYSFYLLLGNRVAGKMSPFIITTYVLTVAAVVFNAVGWTTGSITLHISKQGWLAIVGVAVVSTVIAILTLFLGMRTVGPARTAIISTVEPVITALAAYLFLSEKLTWVQILGGLLVIGAVILVHRDGAGSNTGKQDLSCQ